MSSKHPIHPAANLFPMMGAEEMAELIEDIRAHGLREAIVIFDGQVLDGRNRLKACEAAGVEPFYTELAYCPSPTEWVMSKNLYRRHLTASQRAVIAFDSLALLEEEAKARKVATLKQGEAAPDTATLPEREKGESREIAAKAAGVSARYVSDVKRIAEKAPELVEQIRTGKTSVSSAMEQIKEAEVEDDETIEPDETAVEKAALFLYRKTIRPFIDSFAESVRARIKALLIRELQS